VCMHPVANWNQPIRHQYQVLQNRWNPNTSTSIWYNSNHWWWF
jgi:hypothetical protein